jgi:hypothetical protein
MRPRLLATGIAVACTAVPLGACTEVESASVEGYQPSKLHHVEGAEVQRVTFTPEGARRTALRTASVERRGGHTTIPYAALIYDADGRTWVYTTNGRLSFVRAEVVVDRIDGDRVTLSDGPRPGTNIVTVGAAQVYGTELEISGGH